MKKLRGILNGFTLIELLAVIIILTVIALIATSVVLNVVNSDKYGVVLHECHVWKDTINNRNDSNKMSRWSRNTNNRK